MQQQPCCDALLIAPRRSGLSGFVICDGAGGSSAVARSAQLGTRAAWRALLLLRRHLSCNTSQRNLQQSFLSAFWHCREPGPSADHTLLACLWDRCQVLVVQLGDTSLLARCQGAWQLPLLPARGRYANETSFVRRSTTAAELGIWRAPANAIDAVIGFSDGLEAAFLTPVAKAAAAADLSGVHQSNTGLAELIVNEHRRRYGWQGYQQWLALSLADPTLASLSDDDRTLVIAARR